MIDDVGGVLGAVGTYLVHSTVLLGAAWAIVRVAGPGAGARERVWKCALVLPFVTTALQVTWPERAAASRFRIELPAAELPSQLPPLALDAPSLEPWGHPVPVTSRAGTAIDPVTAALVAVGLISVLGALLPSLRLALALRRRRPLTGGILVDEARMLCEHVGLARPLRITVSESVGSPVAFGTLRPELCVPPRALDLPRPLARALVAHEIAHHVRLDPLWTRLAHAIAAACFFQPLNRVARRELVACAELCADDLAVEWTDDRFGLARCLTEVAAWSAPTAPGAAAVAMVRRAESSGLRQRVERALDRPREPVGRGLVLLALAVGLTLAAVAPGVAHPTSREASPEAAFEGLVAELRTLGSELDALALSADPSIRGRAVRLADRRARLEARIEHLSRLLGDVGREGAFPADLER
ncbi:MAG: M56 family metallopeptidase [Planctomycetota bacterium]